MSAPTSAPTLAVNTVTTSGGGQGGQQEQQQQPPADPMQMIAQAIQQMANLQVGANQNNTPRVRAINCKPYVMGQDFGTYIEYFEENVCSSHNYQPGDVRLDDAYCTWIGSKLEVEATLTAYQRLRS